MRHWATDCAGPRTVRVQHFAERRRRWASCELARRLQNVLLGADDVVVTAVKPRLASVGDRLLARLIDGLVFFLPTSIVLFVAFHGRHATLVRLAFEVPLGAVYMVVPVALFGQTPGKAARRIRIVGPDGQPPGWARAAKRYLVEALPLLVPFRPLAIWIDVPVYLRLLIASDRRGFHDLFAGTRVVSDAAPPPTISELRNHTSSP